MTKQKTAPVKSEPTDRPFWRSRWLVLVLVVAALAPRLIILSQLTESPAFTHPVMDSEVYDDWAWTLADSWTNPDYAGPHGEAAKYLEGSFYMGPLYAYFLTGVYLLFGHLLLLAHLAGILVGVGTVLLTAAIGRRLYGPKIGFIAGLAAALYPALFLYDTAMLMSVLLVFFATLALYLVIRGQDGDRWYHWLGAGMSLGLYALGRANILVFAPVLAVWAFLALWKKVEPGARGFWNRLRARLKDNWKPGLRRVLLVTAGVLAFVVPATIHNAVAGGEFVPVTANGGINLYIGNNELATGEYVNPPMVDVKSDPGGRQYVSGLEVRPMTYGEVSDWWAAKAGEYIGKDFGRWLGLLATKALLFVHRHEIMQVANIHIILGWESPSYFFGVLVVLGLAALVWDRERRRRMGAVWLFVLVYSLTIVAFFVTARYRLPVVPLLLPPAVWAAVELVRRLKEGGKTRLKALALVVPGLLVTNLPLSLFGVELVGNDAVLHNNLGTIYYDQGVYSLAVDEYERAIRANPKIYLTYTNLGLAHLKLGMRTEAQRNFEQALSVYPNDSWALLNLGALFLERVEMGDKSALDTAETYLRRSMELNPGNPEVYRNLMKVSLARGDYAGAAAIVERGLKVAPDDPYFLFWLGGLYAERLNRPAEALDLLRRFYDTRPYTPDHEVALELITYLESQGY
ncbi:MAG: tetratricopeptide repeat protein [bacterium]|nr:tetratricopeptide repeat protein [bacterium]